jgi:hypothetical protein
MASISQFVTAELKFVPKLLIFKREFMQVYLTFTPSKIS